MIRPIARPARVAAFVAALVLPLLAFVPSSQAADPIPTTTRVFATTTEPGTGLTRINARVTSASGIPRGTVTFTNLYDQNVAPVTVPVDATGLAWANLPCNQGPFCSRYQADFTGTNGYASSSDAPGDASGERLNPEPTLVRFGGPGLLKLFLTTAVTVTFTDGTPKEGVPISFSLLGPLTNPGHGTPLIETPVVCTAWSDAQGLATCGGQAAAASILSVLTGAWANRSVILNFNSVKLPTVTVVK